MSVQFRTAHMFQPELETMSRDGLAALQLARLKSTLRRAYDNVPHYRQAFDARKITPDDLKELDDLRHFPFTVKDDLRRNYPFGLFAVPREQVLRLHASSGTTGKPTVVGYSRGDLATWSDLVARTMATNGARPGEVVHIALGYGLFTGGLGHHYGAERLGCTVTPMSGGNTEKQVQLIRDLGATVLCSTPSYALNIAEVAEQMGASLQDGGLRLAVFGAEPWSEELRGEIDRRLGLRAMDTYGLSEIMGPGVAAECEERNGLHGWEDNFLFEILRPDSLEPVAPGEAGELVITTLTKEALPMIRYRTRDITRFIDGDCACGRTHRRFARIGGRNDDMLIVRGVNIFPSQIESVLVGLPNVEAHYQLVVDRDGALDQVAVQVEAAPLLEPSAYASVAAQVRHHLKSLIGISCDVSVTAPNTIPRSHGKAVRVIDLRKK